MGIVRLDFVYLFFYLCSQYLKSALTGTVVCSITHIILYDNHHLLYEFLQLRIHMQTTDKTICLRIVGDLLSALEGFCLLPDEGKREMTHKSDSSAKCDDNGSFA